MMATGGIGLLWQLGAFIVALALLIAVHEFGHFKVAQWCGVKVLRFAIGFGKPLFVKRWGTDQVEFALAAIPLGGYVKMLDEREAPVAPEDLHRAFNRQAVGSRILIVVAGPMANLLLAIFLYWIVLQLGVFDIRPYLAAAPVGTVAAAAGISEGDLVAGVDGQEIGSWSELRLALVSSAIKKAAVELDVIAADGTRSKKVLPVAEQATDHLDGDLARYLGLAVYSPPMRPVVGSVQEGSPAMAVGLMAGDEIFEIDFVPVSTWADFVDRVRASPGAPLEMVVKRGTETVTLTVVPAVETKSGKTIGRIGVAVRPDPSIEEKLKVEIHYAPAEALYRAISQTWETARLTIVVMGHMLVGDVSIRNISGPVAIADYAGQSAQLGVRSFMHFLALISVSLGVLNLLPIPILDGGHLMYYLAEFLKGSPVSERVMEIGQRVGISILGLLMTLALYNDFNRLISG